MFNTCSVFSPSGDVIAKYRKMHLFDINVPGKIRFHESEVLKPGNSFTTFDAGLYNSFSNSRIAIIVCGLSRFRSFIIYFMHRAKSATSQLLCLIL